MTPDRSLARVLEILAKARTVREGYSISYAVLEMTLVRAYDIAPENLLAFRSRFGALQRGGLFGAERPGKGRRLLYRPDQFHRLVFALELSAWGIAPSLILELVREFWESKLRQIFNAAESALMRPSDGGDTALVLIGGDQMFRARDSAFALRLTYAPLRELPACMSSAMRDKPLPARSIVINLSARLRRFHDSLAEFQHLHEELPAAASRARNKK